MKQAKSSKLKGMTMIRVRKSLVAECKKIAADEWLSTQLVIDALLSYGLRHFHEAIFAEIPKKTDATN
jgi:hypothetical protein